MREPEDKNLDLQVERLVCAGCAMGNIRAEEASGAKDDRGRLLELLDLVTISKPTADLPSFPRRREPKPPFPCLFRRRASPNAF